MASGPVTAIFALVDADGGWASRVVHWRDIDYPSQKNSNQHPDPDFIGEFTQVVDGQPIPVPSSRVEGRLIQVELRPYREGDGSNFPYTIRLVIDRRAQDAPQGRPNYSDQEMARVAGYASLYDHDQNREVILPVYRDNFQDWSPIQDGGRSYQVKVMYFIPHAVSITNFAQPRDNWESTFNKAQGSDFQFQPL